MHMTEIRDENVNAPFRESSRVTRINEMHNRMMTFTVSRIWTCLKYRARSTPAPHPIRIPARMEPGICTKLTGETLPPCASPVNAENSTITNTSSTDAPAKISWGMLLSVPYPSSMSLIIFGTITAGETAATTEPMIAASRTVIPRSLGARTSMPRISKQAGTKHIRTAGRPTRFRSSTSSDSPARISMIIRAILRSSAEIPNMELSIRLRA